MAVNTSREGQGDLEAVLPTEFELFRAQKKVVGLSYRDEIIVTNPNNLTIPGYWGGSSSGNQYMWSGTCDGIPIDWHNTYIEMTCVPAYNSAGVVTTYPAGARVAITPDIVASLATQVNIKIGEETFQFTSQFCPQSVFFNKIFNKSKDVTQADGGYEDAFILDGAGPSTGQTQSMSNLLITGAGGATYNLVMQSATVLGLTVNTGTGVNGEALTVQYVVDGQDPINIQSFDSTTTLTGAITFATGTLSGGYYPFDIKNAGLTASDVITFYAGGKTLTFYDVTASNGPIPLTFTATGTAATTTVTVANGARATLVAGDVVYPNYSDLTIPPTAVGFWKRQALTNGGRYANFRLPLKDSYSSFAAWRKILYGCKYSIQLVSDSISQNSMFMYGKELSATPPLLYMQDFRIVIPTLKPTPSLDISLRQRFVKGAREEFKWTDCVVSQTGQPISVGSSTYNQSFDLGTGNPDFLGFLFIPDVYFSSPQNSVKCSIVPSAASNNYNFPLTSGSITIIGLNQQFPVTALGSSKADLNRAFNKVYEAAGRNDSQLFGMAINQYQYVNNYFVPLFDLRGFAGRIAKGSSIQPNLLFVNNFTLLTRVYTISWVTRVSAFNTVILPDGGIKMNLVADVSGQITLESGTENS